jgi:hypothetical protein
MRRAASDDTIHAVGFLLSAAPRQAREPRYFIFWYAVSPRSARKNRIQRMENIMLPQAESAPNMDDRVSRGDE